MYALIVGLGLAAFAAAQEAPQWQWHKSKQVVVQYGLWSAAVAADWSSTQYAISKGGREANPFLSCVSNPHRFGCNPNNPHSPNRVVYGVSSLAVPAAWAVADTAVLPRLSEKWRKRVLAARWAIIGIKFGVAAQNWRRAGR